MFSKYLIDASALYPLVLKLKEELMNYTDRLLVLDLTVYEVGNAIWKEFRRNRIKDLTAVVKLFEEIFSSITIVRPEIELSKVLELAVSEKLTFYEATYLYVARTYGVKLVTEDKELLRYPESINSEQLVKELRSCR